MLSKDQLGKCLGSSNYRICHETFPTELAHSSCLATLFFGTNKDALVTFLTKNVVLPVIEAAENLGYGIWVILSATDSFTMRESSMDSSDALQVRTYPCCQICLITLKCGKQITTPHLKIRSDLGSCHKIQAIQTEVELFDALKHLLTEVSEIDQLPYFNNKDQARITLIRHVQEKLIKMPSMRKTENLAEIAKANRRSNDTFETCFD